MNRIRAISQKPELIQSQEQKQQQESQQTQTSDISNESKDISKKKEESKEEIKDVDTYLDNKFKIEIDYNVKDSKTRVENIKKDN